MSAFICDPAHIREISIFAGNKRRIHPCDLATIARRHGEHETAELVQGYAPAERVARAIARILWRENVASVIYRYPDCAGDYAAAPGWPEGFEESELAASITTGACTYPRVTNPVHILKMVSCYEYQSCEHPDWPTSFAHELCDRIRRAAISALPGYEAAPWEYRDPQDAAPPPNVVNLTDLMNK